MKRPITYVDRKKRALRSQFPIQLMNQNLIQQGIIFMVWSMKTAQDFSKIKIASPINRSMPIPKTIQCLLIRGGDI